MSAERRSMGEAGAVARWQAETRCRKCSAAILVHLDAGDSGAGVAVFYCPACGERCPVEHPAGYDPLTVVASQTPT